MDKIQRLKLTNEVSLKLLGHEFPINGKAVLTINMVNNQVESVEIKNVKKRGETK